MFVAAILFVAFTDAWTPDLTNENVTGQLLLANGNPTCFWPMGLSCDLDVAVNKLKLGDSAKCDLMVPVPIDNYVSDLRRNKFDDIVKQVASKQPYIQITSSREGGTSMSTRRATWLQYVTNPRSVQNEIVFDAPGIYDMTIVANDYSRETSCIGCVAVLDTFRPRYGSSGTCPVAMTTPQALTKASIIAFQNYDNAYRTYTADANVINNANSGSICGIANIDRYSKRKLFHDAERDCYTSCFDDATLAQNIGKLKITPFNTCLQMPFNALETQLNGQCTWCCKKKRTLKEMFTFYQCPTDYESDLESPTASCEIGAGIPNTCSIDVCLQAKGTDVATVSVNIKSSIQSASSAVLDALPSKPAGSDATKHVYYSIPCTSFDKTNVDCRYNVKISELVDVSISFVSTFPTPSTEAGKSKDYVFWRFNMDGRAFINWDPLADTAISFTDASTTVVLEAWTACGRVITTSFTVNLFVHSTLTCTRFDSMWKIVEKPGIQCGEGSYCAYGNSDFAILKVNLAAADVIPRVDNTVTGTYTGVKCDMMVKETGGVDTQAVTIVDDQNSSTINTYYGVELVHNPTTAQKTTGIVHCKFTRIPRNSILTSTSGDTNSIDCSHTFTITDCDKPELNLSRKEDVCADKCANDSADAPPGMFESCGGPVVTSSATNTILKPSATQTCCSKCMPALTCATVGTTDIKRCEPIAMPLQMLVATKAEHVTRTTALIGASALVAVVALVAVKYRVAKRKNVEENNEFYSLLE